MDHILDRSDDEDNIFFENPQTDSLQEAATKKQDMLELEAESDQDLQSKQDEQETHDAQCEDPQLSTSSQFSENIPKLSQENIFFQLNHWNTQMGLQVKELGDDHMGWMKKINSIIQKVTISESTVKSLLSEVMSLEGQIEKLELHQGRDPDKGENIKEKIVEIKKQLGEMDNKFVQVDACNEAHELKEKLVAKIEPSAVGQQNISHPWAASTSPPSGSYPLCIYITHSSRLRSHIISFRPSLIFLTQKNDSILNSSHKILYSENFCKDMTVMNKRLGMYPMREEHTDSRSPEDTGREEMERLLLQVPPTPPEQNFPPRSTLWKRALRIFITFYALTFTVLSCYILFFDATFIFESVLPTMLGRRRTWELREIIVPFLNLEVEDLLPS
ncbi:PREDICTED: single-pass membrane and coiled-coil domain-containing protein 2 isoform X1 [Myotis brandtii]|uniref:single-pass membrane and coiled-coil domain-containing protein 2 isoform X1 n=1 Tax=Myotis brandtii TaxID=109478 RepID=UPI0007043EB5|nr:PREDICTED: single-pass membrane and coiled-coil domain-containing protein 2 isoform X1 [Myotis brandtii]